MPAIQHSQGKRSFSLQLRLSGRVLGFVHSQGHVFCLRIQCKLSSQKDRELVFNVILCCNSTVSNLRILFQKKEILHQNQQKKSSSCTGYDYQKKTFPTFSYPPLQQGRTENLSTQAIVSSSAEH